MRLRIRTILYAANAKVNSPDTRRSPRTVTLRIVPTTFPQPKARRTTRFSDVRAAIRPRSDGRRIPVADERGEGLAAKLDRDQVVDSILAPEGCGIPYLRALRGIESRVFGEDELVLPSTSIRSPTSRALAARVTAESPSRSFSPDRRHFGRSRRSCSRRRSSRSRRLRGGASRSEPPRQPRNAAIPAAAAVSQANPPCAASTTPG